MSIFTRLFKKKKTIIKKAKIPFNLYDFLFNHLSDSLTPDEQFKWGKCKRLNKEFKIGNLILDFKMNYNYIENSFIILFNPIDKKELYVLKRNIHCNIEEYGRISKKEFRTILEQNKIEL